MIRSDGIYSFLSQSPGRLVQNMARIFGYTKTDLFRLPETGEPSIGTTVSRFVKNGDETLSFRVMTLKAVVARELVIAGFQKAIQIQAESAVPADLHIKIYRGSYYLGFRLIRGFKRPSEISIAHRVGMERMGERYFSHWDGHHARNKGTDSDPDYRFENFGSPRLPIRQSGLVAVKDDRSLLMRVNTKAKSVTDQTRFRPLWGYPQEIVEVRHGVYEKDGDSVIDSLRIFVGIIQQTGLIAWNSVEEALVGNDQGRTEPISVIPPGFVETFAKDGRFASL